MKLFSANRQAFTVVAIVCLPSSYTYQTYNVVGGRQLRWQARVIKILKVLVRHKCLLVN